MGSENYKKAFIASLTGMVIVVLCCFTPILVVVLGLVGLSTFTPYLDYVLFPSLLLLIILTIVSYKKWKRSCERHKEHPYEKI